MSWDEFDKDLESEAPRSTFMKWEPGEVHTLVYLGPGDPQKYMDSFKGQAPRPKWCGNFAVLEMGDWRGVVVDMSWGFWSAMREANKLADDLGNTHVYNVKREGSGQNTKYVFAHMRELRDDEAAALDAIEGADLSEIVTAKQSRNG